MQKIEIGNATIWNADCLHVLADMPENSVDLIATDPPYFRVKAEEWDNQWKDEAAFISWIGELCGEWRRVLKPNGSLYVFASPQMAAKVEVKIGEYFNVLNHINWRKEQARHKMSCKDALRAFFPQTERIIFAEQCGSDNTINDIVGYGDKCDEAARDVFGKYIQQIRAEHGLSAKALTEVIGAYGKVNHGGACSNWEKGYNVPTKEHYEKIRGEWPGYFTREYEALRLEYEALRLEYEALRRPFVVNARSAYTDTWDFPTVQAYEGKHPCEKPVSMMRHIIEVSSRPGALVLDCFNGSGATGEAAEETGRQFIGIEKDPHWFNYGCRRIETARAQQRLF